MSNISKRESSGKSKNTLGFWMCTALVVGNMIGSGVFLLPASLAAYGGISIVGWLFTTTGAIFLALVFSRLSRLMPAAGGPYVYTRKGFGDFAGFIVAWGYWISIMAGNAGIAVAFAGYLAVFVPAIASNPMAAALVALISIWLLTWINSIGVRNAGFVQVVTTVLKLFPLIIIAVLGLFYFNMTNFSPFNVSDKSTFSAITATAALTLWAFLGLESATVPADNVRQPEKTIPRATLTGTMIAAAVYIFSTIAVMGIIKPVALAKSTAPFADAASLIWGSWARYAIALGAAISCFGALNGWILLQGQVPWATARDKLFPQRFSRLSKKGTPVFGLVFSSILVTLLMLTNYTKALVELFTFIILLSAMTSLLPYLFSAMAELMFYVRTKKWPEKNSFIRSLIIGGVAFLYSLWAVAGTGEEVVYWGFLLIVSGIPVYVWLKWRQGDRASFE